MSRDHVFCTRALPCQVADRKKSDPLRAVQGANTHFARFYSAPPPRTYQIRHHIHFCQERPHPPDRLQNRLHGNIRETLLASRAIPEDKDAEESLHSLDDIRAGGKDEKCIQIFMENEGKTDCNQRDSHHY